MTPLLDACIAVHVALTGIKAWLVLPETAPCLGLACALTMGREGA